MWLAVERERDSTNQVGASETLDLRRHGGSEQHGLAVLVLGGHIRKQNYSENGDKKNDRKFRQNETHNSKIKV